MSVWKAIELLKSQMAHNHLGNYIVPGVISSLIGGKDKGKVRMFTATRDATDFVTPHSHRFDFAAIVLHGHVWNTLYTWKPSHDPAAETWCKSTIGQVCGENGLNRYNHVREIEATTYERDTSEYCQGEFYFMNHKQIHSIQFARGTVVLFFEGPQITDTSVMLEPWVNGKVIPTFKTEDWMFEKVELP